MPSPYVVTLVGPHMVTRGNGLEETAAKEVVSPRAGELIKEVQKPPETSKTDVKHLEDRMVELTSKKNIERIVRARKMIAVGGNSSFLQKKSSRQPGIGTRSGQAGGGTYEDLIASRIGQEIIFPETGESQLETIVLVKILKDGEIKIQDIEKRSGNTLFDRAALRAIEKANPVPPPPGEMEIGLKLHPYEIKK